MTNPTNVVREDGRIAGKAVLVVGAGSSGDGWGNGKAAAVLYAREGARVLAVDRDGDAAEETRRIIAGEGGRCESFAADASRDAEVADAVGACTEAFGRLDVLHNNVGIVSSGGPVELEEAEWDRVNAVNQKSLYLTCRHAIPEMRAGGGGAIVNISSVTAVRWSGQPMIAYATTKGAVIAFTRHLAVQYAAEGIRANCVLPGYIDTPLVRGPIEARYGERAKEILAARHASSPMGRMGTPWDVAYAALFLASEEARYVTGTEIVVDGGVCASAAGGATL